MSFSVTDRPGPIKEGKLSCPRRKKFEDLWSARDNVLPETTSQSASQSNTHSIRQLVSNTHRHPVRQTASNISGLTHRLILIDAGVLGQLDVPSTQLTTSRKQDPSLYTGNHYSIPDLSHVSATASRLLGWHPHHTSVIPLLTREDNLTWLATELAWKGLASCVECENSSKIWSTNWNA